MKLNRAAFTHHLQRIACGGLVKEVAFTGSFEAVALTEDRLLFVSAPPFPKMEALVDEIGVADLPHLIKSMGLLSGDASESTEVAVVVEEFRLIIDEGHRGTLQYLTAAPTTIATRVKAETAEKLLGGVILDPKKGIPISKALVDGVTKMFSGLKAEELEIQVGKAPKIVVGNENAHMYKFDLPRTRKKVEEYSLLFGKHFVDVLGVIVNFDDALLFLGGPKSMVAMQDGAYTYILSPRTRGAEG